MLLHCQVASFLWSRLKKIFGLVSCAPEKCETFLRQDSAFRNNSEKKAVFWNCLVHAVLWCLWKERNKRIFEDLVSSKEELWEHVVFLASTWAATDQIFKGFSLGSIIRDWKSILGLS